MCKRTAYTGVIAYNEGAVPEIIEDGKTGFIAHPRGYGRRDLCYAGILSRSGATSLAPMNRLLLYSFWEVHLVLWYGGEWPKTKIGVGFHRSHTQMRRKHAEKSMELADEPVR
jgi:hypothetical protein